MPTRRFGDVDYTWELPDGIHYAHKNGNTNKRKRASNTRKPRND